METNPKPSAVCVCKSVFKSGENTISKKQFTEAWIGLINRIEESRSRTCSASGEIRA